MSKTRRIQDAMDQPQRLYVNPDAVLLTKDAVNGHHVPGTPYNWRHDWEPLNATTAAQHGKPWAGDAAPSKPPAPEVVKKPPEKPAPPKPKPVEKLKPLVATSRIKDKRLREIADSALRKVPSILQDPALSVEVLPEKRGAPDVAAEYRGSKVFIYEKAFKGILSGRTLVEGPTKTMSKQELAEYVIVHELGHGVMHGMWNGGQFLGRTGKNTKKFGPQAMRDAFKELRFVTGYAATSPDEAWAEAFMIRIHDPGRKFGPKSEAIFKELGI